MPQRPQLKNDIEFTSNEPDETLRQVVTIQEAVILTGMSRTAIFNQIGKSLRGRPSITEGGTWLVVVSDLRKHYGIKEELLWLIG